MFSRNHVFCLKIWKLWRAPTILQFNIFCWNFAHVLYLPMSTKACVRFFLFYLHLELFEKVKKDLVSTHSFFTLLLITQDLNKIKKIPHTLLWTLLSSKRVQNFSKKIKIYGSWSSSSFFLKSFQFSDKKPGFLEIIEVFLNLGIGFCITWLVLPTKKLIRKSQH